MSQEKWDERFVVVWGEVQLFARWRLVLEKVRNLVVGEVRYLVEKEGSGAVLAGERAEADVGALHC